MHPNDVDKKSCCYKTPFRNIRTSTASISLLLIDTGLIELLLLSYDPSSNADFSRMVFLCLALDSLKILNSVEESRHHCRTPTDGKHTQMSFKFLLNSICILLVFYYFCVAFLLCLYCTYAIKV